MTSYTIRAEVWLHDGAAAWHFVTLPEEVADEIEARTAGPRAGFGTVPVRVTLGGSTWETSLFPDRKAASYLLPLKAGIRRREGVEAGDGVELRIELRA